MRTVGIIGGGITGLSAAYYLSKKNFKVTIYESSNSLGGLAGGFQTDGMNIEKAYHHIFKSDKYILDLIEELGISNPIEWNDSSVSNFFEGQFYPLNTPIDLLNLNFISKTDRIKTGLAILYLSKTNNWEKLEYVSASNWLKKYCGNSAYQYLWKPLLKGKFYNYSDNISMAWFWARIHTRANSREKNEQLGYPIGGFEKIITALSTSLEKNNIQIHLNSPITSIDVKDNKPTIQVFNKTKSYDYLISTVPSHIFSNLIKNSEFADNEYLNKLNSINYVGAISLYFESDQNLTTSYWNNILDSKSPFIVCINHTQLIDKGFYKDKNIYYLCAYLPHNHYQFSLEDTLIIKNWFGYLKKIIPEFDMKEVTKTEVFKFKNAQHIVDTDYRKKIPDYKTPFPNTFLSNFSQIFPEDRGTNFAVREGKYLSSLVT